MIDNIKCKKCGSTRFSASVFTNTSGTYCDKIPAIIFEIIKESRQNSYRLSLGWIQINARRIIKNLNAVYIKQKFKLVNVKFTHFYVSDFYINFKLEYSRSDTPKKKHTFSGKFLCCSYAGNFKRDFYRQPVFMCKKCGSSYSYLRQIFNYEKSLKTVINQDKIKNAQKRKLLNMKKKELSHVYDKVLED